MILVKPSFEILTPKSFMQDYLNLIEMSGRTCYKSESKGNPESFISNILKSGHESVIEHANISVKIICDRGVTHEIVRHRLVSYSQESTRYCNYRGGVTFVIPLWCENLKSGEYQSIGEVTSVRSVLTGNENIWFQSMWLSESHYIDLLENGWTPQQARSVLPNSLKTELVMTCNLREWRHFFKLRTAKAAHPQMREIAIPMLKEFKELLPVIFESIKPNL